MASYAPEYRKQARDLVAEKGRMTPTEIIKEIGNPPPGIRLKSDGRGSVTTEPIDKRRARREKAETKRSKAVKPKTEGEAAYMRQVQRQARAQSQSTEAQFVSGGRPSIAEHDVRVASGGSSEFMSVSDPEFKLHKDKIEDAAYRKFGEKVVVDIDDVSGDVRLIPAQYHNKYQPTSQQPGIDIPMGTDIDKALNKFASTKFKPTRLIDRFTPAQRRRLNAAPTMQAKELLLKEFKNMPPTSIGGSPLSPLNRGSAAYGGIETEAEEFAQSLIGASMVRMPLAN